MKANGNRDFPFMLSLSEPFSEQGGHYHRKPEFDYVFFGPGIHPDVGGTPALELENGYTARLLKARAGSLRMGVPSFRDPN